MKSTRNIFSLLLLLLFVCNAEAQFHLPVFPDFDGQELLDKTVSEYKTTTVLGYGPARDTMYAAIYNDRDSVKGIYTNHAVYLPPNVDPSVAIFMGGSPNGINAEHSYPQSKGAANGNAKSDMHHIFPSRTPVNSDRGSLPFMEINDQNTTSWYYKTNKLSGIPTNNIDIYSEGNATGFEPAEDKKGNIARAIFYFYTMYKAEADAADSNFFESQRETLCNWHYLDPVDSLEWMRTYMIAKHQGDNPNPFILDCSLASRSYCAGIAGFCNFVNSTKEVSDKNKSSLKIYPNPASERLFLDFTLREKSEIQVNFYNSLGRKISTEENLNFPKGNHKVELPISSSGLIFVETQIKNNDNVEVFFKKILVRK